MNHGFPRTGLRPAIFLMATFWGMLAVAQGANPLGLDPAVTNPHEVRLVDAREGDEMYPVNINNAWGLMNRHGELLVYPRYEWTDFSYENRARAVIDGMTGYVRIDGDFVIPPQFKFADRFEDGKAIVSDGRVTTFITLAGRPLTSLRFDAALRFREGMAAVQIDRRIGFIDAAGKLSIPATFVVGRSFHDGVAAVREQGAGNDGGAWGYIDKRGEVVHRFGDDVLQVGDFEGGQARVQVKTSEGLRWGYISRKYRPAIAPRFTAARDFHDGLAAVRVDERWGFIDRRGELVIPAVFTAADDFQEGLAMVRDERWIGYVSKDGKWAIPPQYRNAQPLFRGLAAVAIDEATGYVDRSHRLWFDSRWLSSGVRLATRRELATIVASPTDDLIGNRLVRAPRPRTPAPAPYPPEHLYEEVLPKR